MKNSSLWIRTAIILVITLIAIYMVFGPRESFTSNDFTWEGIKKNLANNINLGLDLKGGSHLVMRVKTDEYLKTLTVNNKDAAVYAAKDSSTSGDRRLNRSLKKRITITINVTDSTKVQEVIDAIKKKVDLRNWTESKTDSSINWSLPVQMQKELSKQAVEQALKIIESRINNFGVKEPTLQKVGAEDSGQILLQMPGVDDPERVKQLIRGDAKLELMKVVGASNPSPMTTYPTREAALASIGGQETSNRKIFPYMERDDNAADKPDPQANQPKAWVVLESPAIIDGERTA